jgi:citrate synthase
MVQDLAENASFEEVAYLLLYEKLPENAELEEFKRRLLAERYLPPTVIEVLKNRPKDALPMDILQAAVPLLAHHDPDKKDQSMEPIFYTCSPA